MVKQMRALDSYGTYDGWPNERVLAPYIVTKDQRREIPVIGDPDEVLLARVKAFYNGLAVLVEKECGLMATSVINITHEGFGRALIIVGKLVGGLTAIAVASLIAPKATVGQGQGN